MDVVLAFLTAVYVGLLLGDARVTYRLWAANRVRPRVEALWAALLVSAGITAGVAGGVILGLNAVALRLFEVRFVSPDWTLPILALALALPSLANAYLLRLIRRWERGSGTVGLHMRAPDVAPHRHRRIGDPPRRGGPLDRP